MSIERKKLEKQLDKAFGDFIKERDNFSCCICGVTKDTHIIDPGHLISRVNRSTRWHEDNCFAQCRGHNFSHEHHPEIMTQWYINKFGMDQYNLIVYTAGKSAKFTISDLKVMIDLYKNKLKELREGKE